MKKLVLFTSLAVCALTMNVADAKTMICGYVDHMHMASNSPAKPVIQGNITSDGDTTGVQTGVDSFDIHDNQTPGVCNMSSQGTVHVTYYASQSDYCVLNFLDGASNDNPQSIDPKCYGKLHYLGANYDGLWSYSYSMIFSMG